MGPSTPRGRQEDRIDQRTERRRLGERLDDRSGRNVLDREAHVGLRGQHGRADHGAERIADEADALRVEARDVRHAARRAARRRASPSRTSAHRRRDVRPELQERAERIAGEQLRGRGRRQETEDVRRHVERVGFGESVGTGNIAAHGVHLVLRRRRAVAMLEGVDRQHRDARACRRLGGGKARSRGWH